MNNLENIFLTRDVEDFDSWLDDDRAISEDESDDDPELDNDEPEKDRGEVMRPGEDEAHSENEQSETSGAEKAPPTSILQTKVAAVLRYMDSIGLKADDLLVGLSWGDEACIQDPKIRASKDRLLQSPKFPGVLQRWATPPRSGGGKKRRPEGASTVMTDFAIERVVSLTTQELRSLAPELTSPSTSDVEEATFRGTTFDDITSSMQDLAPTLWKILRRLLVTKRQEKINTHKDPEKVLVVIMAMISYSRSHHNSRLQKLLSIYLKFKGISAKGFDTLHAMGLTMSHKWTCDSVKRMSEKSMAEVRDLLKTLPWLISYDNVNIPMRTFSQRVEKDTDNFGSGTAATVYVKRDAVPLPSTANPDLKAKRSEGLQNPIQAIDILDLLMQAAPRYEQQTKYEVLQVLFNAPAFKHKTYKGRQSELLKPPTPVESLPCGPEHATLQYLLGSVNIAEASYEDNERLVQEWMEQMGLGGEDEMKKTALERVIVWVGDQLTVGRLRGLFQFRASDSNSYDRLDYSVFQFGWFHLLMAHAKSLHKQYLGTEQGRSLKHAFTLLEKKGLDRALTKGPFHHDLDEVIHEIAEAHFRLDWLKYGKVKDLKDLRKKEPSELVKIAHDIYTNRASAKALERHDSRPENQHDEEYRQLIMWNRDVLQYLVLDRAMEDGDVGMMESMLPTLYLRFLGAGSGNYANEVIELLQSLHREWPAEIRDFVRRHCWLVNTTGREHQFCAVDQCQEHNIKDIKVTYRSEGPNIKWDYLRMLHPAIHTIRAVADHVEHEYGTYTRGKRHTVPSREQDIETLRKAYEAAKFDQFTPGRKIGKGNDKASDYLEDGMSKLHKGDGIAKWDDQRRFERSTLEIWEESEGAGSEYGADNMGGGRMEGRNSESDGQGMSTGSDGLGEDGKGTEDGADNVFMG